MLDVSDDTQDRLPALKYGKLPKSIAQPNAVRIR